MMGQVQGHSRIFAILDCNWMVRPPTMMVSKVTMKSGDYVQLFGGVVQAATAKAVVDAVAEGIIPKDQVDDLVIIASIWMDPKANLKDSRTYNKDELYKSNYEATKKAIKNALTSKPSIEELIKKKDDIKHCLI